MKDVTPPKFQAGLTLASPQKQQKCGLPSTAAVLLRAFPILTNMESKTTYQQFSGAINECFSELTDTMTNGNSEHHAISVTLYDQYLDRLYTDDGDIKYEQWNQSTVDAMKADIAKLKNQVRDGF